MLEAGAETERHMQGGDTALHQAAWNGHTRAAQLLLDNGASMSATKEDGDTPLHLACLRKQLDVARLLIERKSELGSTVVRTSMTSPSLAPSLKVISAL